MGEGKMRQGIQAGAVLVLLGLASAVLAQTPGRRSADTPTEEGSLWESWFGNKPKPEPQKPTTRPVQVDRALQQDRLMKAVLRRITVCDRLREVGRETNNTSLQEEADRLEDLAWRLYHRQSRLSGSQDGLEVEDAMTTLQANSPGESGKKDSKSPDGKSVGSGGAGRAGLPMEAHSREQEGQR